MRYLLSRPELVANYNSGLLQRFLRVMLLVALVGLPCVRANLADRVVPEEQFYDDSSEAAFSTKAGDHEQTRDTRVDAEEGKFERIQELLSSLKGSISNEQLQCDSKQQVRPEQRAVRWGCLPCIMRRPMRKRARLRRLHQRFAVWRRQPL